MEETQFREFLTRAQLDIKTHQIEGVKWCLNNEIKGNEVDEKTIRGGLLADDMGLGKTIQILGVMNGNIKDHTLIVLPKALLKQWKDAIILYIGIEPLVFHASGNRKATEELLISSPIVLTTYTLLTERKSMPNLLKSIKWDRVIYDEAHHLRTPKSKIYKAAICLNAEIKWLITGTPIQNRKSDFYSLCAVMGIPKSYYINEDNLMNLVRAFIKKRTKKEVGIKLPELQTTTISVQWNNEKEFHLAEEIHSKLNFTQVSSSSRSEQLLSFATKMSETTILPLLIKARQMCILPSLVKTHVKYQSQASSKMDVVIETIINRKDNGRAKLIFCHFRGEIDAIKENLQKANMTILTFDGRSTEKQRAYALSKDNKCDVLILQIQTGCEGLNLQQFSEVYFVSPHWNPAIEDQAVARCHRIGQENNINVFRFEMCGFDEENKTKSLDKYAFSVQETKRGVMSMIENPNP
jgi:SNF2 family DNA or RNA helicase